MLANSILSNQHSREKLLTALLALLSAKLIIRIAVVSAFLLLVLWVFVLILGAVHQLCTQVAQIWMESSSIEKLLIFLIAWAFFYKMSPVLARLIKKGV